MKKLASILFNTVATIVVLVVLLFSLLNFLSAPQASGLFGFKGYTVMSNSMEPRFSAGNYIIDRVIDYDAVKIGDVISYEDSTQTIVTHRAVEKTADGIKVQGDGNDFADKTVVTKDNLIGKQLYAVPAIGLLLARLSNPLILAGICGVIALFLIYLFFKKR